MNYKILIFFMFVNILLGQNLTDSNQIQIGIYALQSPPGTNGHQTGSLKDIEADVKSVMGTINASIPYRHWDRVNYPNWDFNKYFLTYLEDMYSLTFNPDDLSCVQSFTPPMYSSFLDPPLASMPDDDRWYNRNLDFDLFQYFIKNILEKELSLIKNSSSGDKDKFLKIITDQELRPLGGWYLDDEPLIRNHDIEVIETMSEVIRLIEKDFFHEKIVPLGISENLLEKYLHPRYIAFDGDDLHKYPKSGRSFDGKFYNKDGNTFYFTKNKIYSVFQENTFDVLLLDFYHNNIPFWEKMFNDIESEFTTARQKIPIVMPVINAQVALGSTIDAKQKEIDELVQLFTKLKMPGMWLYIWDDFDSKNLDTKVIWNDKQQKLKTELKSLKK